MLSTDRIEEEMILDGKSSESYIRLLIFENAMVPSQSNVPDKKKRKIHQSFPSADPV